MQMERYVRQIMVPEFGEEGQKKLFNAKVLVVGAGGLGSAAIAYLAAAGVGKLGIVDGDTVEESNLQRQIIHAGSIGINKAESARDFVEKLNPDVKVKTYSFGVTAENAQHIILDYDIVVSCPDNFVTRYILNDACRISNKPMVHAAVYGFEGEAMTIKNSPCYRCILPEAPKFEAQPVMGFTAGFFGCIQAAEAIKLITGVGKTLEELLRVDLSSMEFFEIPISKNPKCPICNGKLKKIHEENYKGSCRIVKY
jgi:adenylyltransferase/sulfurtransferase